MDSDDWLLALVVADAERRRAESEAEEEQEQLKEEYDEWCIDHGIPPPPERESRPRGGSGCLCIPVAILGVALVVFLALFLR